LTLPIRVVCYKTGWRTDPVSPQLDRGTHLGRRGSKLRTESATDFRSLSTPSETNGLLENRFSRTRLKAQYLVHPLTLSPHIVQLGDLLV
jgi:hypothetical protein